MQVLIPISSRSPFFPEAEYFFPKPLIEVDGLPMIQRVLNSIKSYIDDPKFIFVVDREDCVRFSLDKLLQMECGESAIIKQKNTETSGALCSTLLAIDDLDPEEPLLISNGDTLLDGLLKFPLERLMHNKNDCGVFTFESIHPRWSYVRGNEKNIIEQVYEKEVVSNKAIAGVYYFKKTVNYIEAAKKVILDGVCINGQYYISSAVNQIILTGGTASFIGLEQNQVHTFYSPSTISRFEARVSAGAKINEKKINIVVPAAGLGSRFANEGWKKPKPFIDVAGEPMVNQVMENLKADNVEFTILLQKGHINNYPDNVEKISMSGAKVLSVPKLTEGTACTVLSAERYINNDDYLMIANSDQLVDFKVDKYIQDCERRDLDGSILVFKDNDPKWSYAKVSENGLVSEVAEKKPISEFATVGIYLFKTGRSFVSAAIEMIVANDRVNNEFYTCPVYNYLINRGARIGIYEIDAEKMHGIGTPVDLVAYLQENNYPMSADAPS